MAHEQFTNTTNLFWARKPLNMEFESWLSQDSTSDSRKLCCAYSEAQNPGIPVQGAFPWALWTCDFFWRCTDKVAIPLEPWHIALGCPRPPCTYSRCGATPEMDGYCLGLEQSYPAPHCRGHLGITMSLRFTCNEPGLASAQEMCLELMPVCEDWPRALLWGQALSPEQEMNDRLENTHWDNM